MPMIKLSLPKPEIKTVAIQQQVSKIVAAACGKPEAYIMVVTEKADFLMAGQVAAGAFIEVRGIGGIAPEVNAKISRQIAELLCAELNLTPENIYLNFFDIPRSNWGNSGGTF